MRDRTIDERYCAVVTSAEAPPNVGRILGQDAVGEGHRTTNVHETPTSAVGEAAPQREPLKGEVASGCDMDEPETKGVGRPFDDGFGPHAPDGQGTGNRGEPIRP